MTQEATKIQLTDAAAGTGKEQHESYLQLVWHRFRRSKPGIVGGLMVLGLIVMAVFAEFFSPTDPRALSMSASFTPPQRIHFIDAEGKFHLRPFTYLQVVELDPTTFEPRWAEDTSQRYKIKLFPQSWEWKIVGLIPTRYHLFGVEEGGTIYLLGTERFGRDLWGRSCVAGRISLSLSLFAVFISVAVGSIVGVTSGYYGGWIDNLIQRFIEFVQSFPTMPLWMALAALIPPMWSSFRIFTIMSLIFALLGWTQLARETRGKVMAFRETDFILAAKEMGASDRRIIFKHLYPNCLSHIIVMMTLQIPAIILSEAFLSFLGIGIQEPLTSWGLLMNDANSLQTLGVNPWIMLPVIFIVTAVLGFNFMGDGLRDAADPYATMR
jgi:peptide/nickel transport system permease protein